MKKFTRFFATVAAVSMVAASLAGCGSKSDNTASTDTTADSATAGDTLKIGGIGPITGRAAIYGQAVKKAAQMADDKINADGGINGKINHRVTQALHILTKELDFIVSS